MSSDRDVNFGAVAMYVAAAMNHSKPLCSDNPYANVSTITVEQHKTKFGQVRVYVKFADPKLVDAEWANKEINDRCSYEEFVKRCFIRDAIQYRRAYRSMETLLTPEEFKHLCSSADYSELLFTTYDEVLQYVKQQHCNWFTYYHCDDDRVNVLCKICNIKKGGAQ